MKDSQTGWVRRGLRAAGRHPFQMVFVLLGALLVAFVFKTYFAHFLAQRKMQEYHAYFEQRCEEIAGEFIYRTVEDVEGFVMLRRRDGRLGFRDRMQKGEIPEDPYGHADFSATHPESFVWGAGNGYQYLELPAEQDNHRGDFGLRDISNKSWVRIERSTSERDDWTSTDISAPTSKMALSWKDLGTETDRARGLHAGVTALFDLSTQEVLARRIGIVFYFNQSAVRRLDTCGPGWNVVVPFDFVQKVFVPTPK